MATKLTPIVRLAVRINFLLLGPCLPVVLVAHELGITAARTYQVVAGLPAGIGDAEAVKAHDQELRARYQREARRPDLSDAEWAAVLFEARREASRQSRAISYRIVVSEVERTVGSHAAA